MSAIRFHRRSNLAPRAATGPTVPGAPTNPAVSGMVASWSAPTSDGGATITGYESWGEGPANGTQATGTVPGTTFSRDFSGNLPPGDDYDIYVRAQNSVGYGPAAYCGIISV